MEKQQQIIGPYENEYMKMAMLKHEETFKEQVYELHRLYQIQKILMKSIGRSEAFGRGGNTSANSNSFFIEKKGQSSKSFNNGVVEAAAVEEEESQIELTLGLGPNTSSNNYNKRTSSSSSTVPKKLRDSKNMHFNFTSDSTTSFSTSSTRSVKLGGSLDVVEEDSSTERMKQYPPWILQLLTLNSTWNNSLPKA